MRIDVDISAGCAASGTVRARIPTAKPRSFTTAEPKNLGGVIGYTDEQVQHIFDYRTIIYLYMDWEEVRGEEEGCTRHPLAAAAPESLQDSRLRRYPHVEARNHCRVRTLVPP